MNLTNLEPFRKSYGEAFMVCPASNPLAAVVPFLKVGAAFLVGVIACAALVTVMP